MIEDRTRQADLWRYVERHRAAIENSVRAHLPLAPPVVTTEFNRAVEYAAFSGGKRLRPVLTLLAAELVGGAPERMFPAAIAGEFVHTSSLIFDDLPCMDNASERRGKTSLHERFGEGLAVLVAIGFLNQAYDLVFVNQAETPARAVVAHREIVEAVGAAGMVGGQSLDLALAKGAGDFDDRETESIRNLKTSALMRLSLKVGAILAGADSAQLAQLSDFARLLGDAYQLSDDLIDSQEDAALFAGNKTRAALEGNRAARRRLETIVEDAKRILIENFPANEARGCLIELTDYLTTRKN